MHKIFIHNDIEVRVLATSKALEPEARKQYEELSLASAEVNAIEVSRIARAAKRTATTLTLRTSALTLAGSVVGFGSTTEITRLFNNTELVLSVAQ